MLQSIADVIDAGAALADALRNQARAPVQVQLPDELLVRSIGNKGERMKEIGRNARLAMQTAFGSKVYLGLWVKVRAGWSDDARVLRSLGYGDDT